MGATEHRTKLAEEQLLDEIAPLITMIIDPGVEDISITEQGATFVRRRGGPWLDQEIAWDSETVYRIIHLAAATLGDARTINANHPMLEMVLPIAGARFSALLPPIVSGPIFSIRTRQSFVIPLAQHEAEGTLTRQQFILLWESVRIKRNILVCGITGSGKTTLVNSLLRVIGDQQDVGSERIVLIEDTPELVSSVPNTLSLLAVNSVTMNDLARATMRQAPDRIIVGEVRSGEALAMLKAWNTGHGGGLATIHANDGYEALIRLEEAVAEATAAPERALIARTINLVMVIRRDPDTASGRKVTGIYELQKTLTPGGTFHLEEIA